MPGAEKDRGHSGPEGAVRKTRGPGQRTASHEIRTTAGTKIAGGCSGCQLVVKTAAGLPIGVRAHIELTRDTTCMPAPVTPSQAATQPPQA